MLKTLLNQRIKDNSRKEKINLATLLHQWLETSKTLLNSNVMASLIISN